MWPFWSSTPSEVSLPHAAVLDRAKDESSSLPFLFRAQTPVLWISQNPAFPYVGLITDLDRQLLTYLVENYTLSLWLEEETSLSQVLEDSRFIEDSNEIRQFLTLFCHDGTLYAGVNNGNSLDDLYNCLVTDKSDDEPAVIELIENAELHFQQCYSEFLPLKLIQ